MPDDTIDFTYEPIASNTHHHFPEINHANSHIDSNCPTYHRSHIYRPRTVHNTLLASAWPVISSAMRCQEIRLTNVSNHNLDNLLSHEVKAFESQARKYGHHKTTILAARYCLCAYIDDQFRRYGLADYRANEHSFLQHYHQTTLDQEQTHLIVSRCQQHAYEFTELMELIYILYRIGFEGRSRQSIDDYKTLLSKTDQLFQQLKPSKPQTLYVQAPNEPQYCSESNQSSTRLWLNQSKLTAIATVSLCLIVIGAGLWLL